jgi:predicted transcriptional regulator
MLPAMVESLEQIGQELDRPVAWVIRAAIDEYVERWNKGGK